MKNLLLIITVNLWPESGLTYYKRNLPVAKSKVLLFTPLDYGYKYRESLSSRMECTLWLKNKHSKKKKKVDTSFCRV